MRFIKLILTAGVVCVATGTTGTGVMVAISQEKKAPPAEASKDQAKPEIKEPFETAFPDIKAFGEPGVDCPRFTGKTAVPADSNDSLRRLAKARLDSLVTAFSQSESMIQAGRRDAVVNQTVMQLHRDIAAAAADTLGPGDELVHWYQEWVSVAKRQENWFQQRFKGGDIRRYDLEIVRAERFHAERELHKVMARVKAGQAK